MKAGYPGGLGKDPNRLEYAGPRRASLKVELDFNPTYPGEGPLTREISSFQYEVPGIQKTKYRQYESKAGEFVPTSSDFLRVYNPETGYEKLDRNGIPLVLRSPVKAFWIEVDVHLDRTTHGISAGLLNHDIFTMLGFRIDKPFGDRTI